MSSPSESVASDSALWDWDTEVAPFCWDDLTGILEEVESTCVGEDSGRLRVKYTIDRELLGISEEIGALDDTDFLDDETVRQHVRPKGERFDLLEVLQDRISRTKQQVDRISWLEVVRDETTLLELYHLVNYFVRILNFKFVTEAQRLQQQYNPVITGRISDWMETLQKKHAHFTFSSRHINFDNNTHWVTSRTYLQNMSGLSGMIDWEPFRHHTDAALARFAKAVDGVANPSQPRAEGLSPGNASFDGVEGIAQEAETFNMPVDAAAVAGVEEAAQEPETPDFLEDDVLMADVEEEAGRTNTSRSRADGASAAKMGEKARATETSEGFDTSAPTSNAKGKRRHSGGEYDEGPSNPRTRVQK